LGLSNPRPRAPSKPTTKATIALERTKSPGSDTSSDRGSLKIEAIEPSFVELFSREARRRVESSQECLSALDQNPMDLESLSPWRSSTPEGQRPDGRCAQHGEFAVHRKSAEPHHRIDLVAHTGYGNARAVARCLRGGNICETWAGERPSGAGRSCAGPLPMPWTRSRIRRRRRKSGGIARIHMAAHQLGRRRAARPLCANGKCLTPLARRRRLPQRQPMAPAVMIRRCMRFTRRRTSSHLQEIRAYLNKERAACAVSDSAEGVFLANTLEAALEDGGGAAGIRIRRAAESCHGVKALRQARGVTNRWN